MSKLSGIEKVAEFMQMSKQTINSSPCLVDRELAELRFKLIREENSELLQAVEADDLVEVLDALVDLQYVLYGAVLTFGMQHIWKQAFEEVHINNMTKGCKSIEEADATIEFYSKQGISVFAEKVGDLYVVYRTSDKKVMKSIDYIKVSLSKFIPDVTSNKSTR